MLFARFLAAAILCLVAAAPAQDLSQSTATIDPAAVGASIFNVPDGTGRPLTQAYQHVSPGVSTVVDATILLTLIADGEPIFGYPHEDMWLESTLGNLIKCDTSADASTDIHGMTTWSTSLKAGGWGRDWALGPATEELVILVGGYEVPQTVPLRFNSADVNGDLVVNLVDVSLFVGCLPPAPYCYLCDFNYDGVRNLVDVSILASAVGAECP